MPHAGHANSITNDGPRFYSNISDKSSPNPSLEPSRKVLCQRVTQVYRMARATTERCVTLNLRTSSIGFAIDSTISK